MKTIKLLAAGLTSAAFATGASAATLSPTSAGELPSTVSAIGGVVVDIIGLNGTRVVTQAAASSLFEGLPNFTPLTFGTQTGLTAAVTDQLGGGIAEIAVRVTLDDGDTAPGDFDEGENDLLLNGVTFGNFSDVATVETNAFGDVLSSGTGFENNDLDTGFFFSDDATTLASIYTSILDTEEIAFGLLDVDFGDNFFDFTQGIDESLIDVGSGPVVTPVPPTPNPNVVPLPAAGWMLIAGLGGLAAMRRRKASIDV